MTEMLDDTEHGVINRPALVGQHWLDSIGWTAVVECCSACIYFTVQKKSSPFSQNPSTFNLLFNSALACGNQARD
jgi:hypothetical protein